MKKIAVLLLLPVFIFAAPLASNAKYSQTTVGKTELMAHDSKRNRDVKIFVWYPVAPNTKATQLSETLKHMPVALNAPISTNGKRPLILLSHGSMGKPEYFAWMGDRMAVNGYIVAAPQHTSDLTDPPSTNYWHRPLDMSFTLTTLLNSKFKPFIDQKQIGFIGYSLGGATGLWLAGAIAEHYERIPYVILTKHTNVEKGKKSYHDPRIKAEFLMAPAKGAGFSKASLNKITVPIQIVATSGDTEVDPAANAFFYAKQIPTVDLKMIPGKGSHYVFRASILPGKLRIFDPTGKLDFNFKDDPSVNREQLHNTVSLLALKFFNKIFKKPNDGAN